MDGLLNGNIVVRIAYIWRKLEQCPINTKMIQFDFIVKHCKAYQEGMLKFNGN